VMAGMPLERLREESCPHAGHRDWPGIALSLKLKSSPSLKRRAGALAGLPILSVRDASVCFEGLGPIDSPPSVGCSGLETRACLLGRMGRCVLG